jgi:hypothetical protein
MAVDSDRTRAPTRDVAPLFAAYLAGDSLAVIGERKGVSGERIRQLFRAAGYPTLASAHTNRQRSQERRAELQAPVVDAYRRLESNAEVAKLLGISVGLATSVPAKAGIEAGAPPISIHRPTATRGDRHVLHRRAHRSCPQRGRNHLREAIPGDAPGRGVNRRPSMVMAEVRPGAKTWDEALTMAGVPPCAPGAGSRGVENQELATLLVDLRKALGRLPTASEFAKAASSAGLPGIQSVKRRFGSWDSFVADLPPAADTGSVASVPTPISAEDRP